MIISKSCGRCSMFWSCVAVFMIKCGTLDCRSWICTSKLVLLFLYGFGHCRPTSISGVILVVNFTLQVYSDWKNLHPSQSAILPMYKIPHGWLHAKSNEIWYGDYLWSKDMTMLLHMSIYWVNLEVIEGYLFTIYKV